MSTISAHPVRLSSLRGQEPPAQPRSPPDGGRPGGAPRAASGPGARRFVVPNLADRRARGAPRPRSTRRLRRRRRRRAPSPPTPRGWPATPPRWPTSAGSSCSGGPPPGRAARSAGSTSACWWPGPSATAGGSPPRATRSAPSGGAARTTWPTWSRFDSMRCWSRSATGPHRRPRSPPRSPSACGPSSRPGTSVAGSRSAGSAPPTTRRTRARDLAVDGLRQVTSWLRAQLDGSLGDGDPGPVVIPPPLPLPRPLRLVAVDALDRADAVAGTVDAAADRAASGARRAARAAAQAVSTASDAVLDTGARAVDAVADHLPWSR